MRILVLSNFYPPYTLGGQEQSCRKVVDGLKLRGHEVFVLTSTHGVGRVCEDSDSVYRALYMETDLVAWRQSINFFTQARKREIHNLEIVDRVMDQFEPEIVFIWGMWNLSRSIPARIEAKYSGRVVYRFADYWPLLPSQRESYWRTPGRTSLSRLPKRFLGSIALAMLSRAAPAPALQFEQAIFVSAATREKLKEAGIHALKSSVVHTGIDFQLYQNGNKDHRNGKTHLNLLYAGRLLPEKGVETAIQALGELVRRRGINGVRLNIAGNDPSRYGDVLRLMVSESSLDDHISFLGNVPHEDMPALLQENDILLLPSQWDEPFARIVLEGMISGLVVVATPCGGTVEIVEDQKNGLLFAPGNADDLADKISLLKHDLSLRQKLAEAGVQTVKENFTFQAMMDKIENFLLDVARSSRSWDTVQYRKVSEEPALTPL